MVLKIERYYTNQYYTLGNLYLDNELLGKVCEPPVRATMSDDLTAIPEGYYGIKVKINPAIGVPCIKLKNDDVADNITLRCMRPMSPNNASPYICKVLDNNKVDKKHIDFDTWSYLLNACLINKVNDGGSYLYVSQPEPHQVAPLLPSASSPQGARRMLAG